MFIVCHVLNRGKKLHCGEQWKFTGKTEASQVKFTLHYDCVLTGLCTKTGIQVLKTYIIWLKCMYAILSQKWSFGAKKGLFAHYRPIQFMSCETSLAEFKRKLRNNLAFHVCAPWTVKLGRHISLSAALTTWMRLRVKVKCLLKVWGKSWKLLQRVPAVRHDLWVLR